MSDETGKRQRKERSNGIVSFNLRKEFYDRGVYQGISLWEIEK